MLNASNFKRTMLIASALSWVLVTLMPVINAHGASAGVWATLCTINGFELIQIEEGKAETQHAKPCPFSHFSTFHQDTFPTPTHRQKEALANIESYTYLALSERFQLAIPRAPPLNSLLYS
ncbi:hypothetical protein TW81_06035 [Vibrio galatheae]|uniref:DUF2946 domain-containing protein n=1 Tax=Vibrio galatheae TaxID=579748 RepID=A0A0F4NLZ1_9VIBR|nr:hypothetical protein [Vibrio galatheae]KJY83883.1 hypothetical protein TW81_06035 [Vibrio galatheae]